MESDNSKVLDNEPSAKRVKMDLSAGKDSITRTVATMCGSWRGEETDGGLVLVYKTRDPGLSPDPKKEEDFPENIEDVWVQSDSPHDDIQVFEEYLYLFNLINMFYKISRF